MLPVEAATADASEFQAAVTTYSARLTGGGPISIEETTDLLDQAGYDQITPLDHMGQVVMLARRP